LLLLQIAYLAVDAFYNAVDVPEEIERNIDDKVLYVLAMDNGMKFVKIPKTFLNLDLGLRELAAKYASDFLSLEMRKLRTDSAWIKQTLEYPVI
jgi:hypothetical protein